MADERPIVYGVSFIDVGRGVQLEEQRDIEVRFNNTVWSLLKNIQTDTQDPEDTDAIERAGYSYRSLLQIFNNPKTDALSAELALQLAQNEDYKEALVVMGVRVRA